MDVIFSEGGNWFVLARQTSEERREDQITEEGEKY